MNSSDENSVECINYTPPELQDIAVKSKNDLIPIKSKDQYLQEYNYFLEWKSDVKCNVINEDVMIAYFNKLSKNYKPSSLWKKYSVLKTMIKLKHKVNIGDFVQLLNLLKNKSKGYIPKKSKIFTSDEMRKFVDTAPDEKYLSMKVVLILGIYGACRQGELLNLEADNVTINNDLIKVVLKETKSSTARIFVIDGEWMLIVKKYIDLRSKIPKSNVRFFLRYYEGRCFNQPIGKNTIAEMPGKIARFLNLKDPQMYTVHSFRRSAATLAADSSMSMIDLKRLEYKSTSVAEGYIEESLQHKKKTSKQIINVIVGNNELVINGPEVKKPKCDSVSTTSSEDNIQNVSSVITHQADKISLNISGCTNVNVYFK